MNIKAGKIISALFVLFIPLVLLTFPTGLFARGLFYVDAGSFKSFITAWTAAKKFSENGFAASVEIVEAGVSYNIYIGPYESRIKAESEAYKVVDADLISNVKIIFTENKNLFFSIYAQDITKDKKHLNMVENSIRPLKPGLNKIDDKEMASVAASGIAIDFIDYGVIEEGQNLFGHNVSQIRLFELDKDGVSTSIYNFDPKTTALYTDTMGGHVQISDHFLIIDGDGLLTPAQKLSSTAYKANYTLFNGLYYNTVSNEWEGTLNLDTFFNDYYVYVPGNGAFYIDNFFLDLEFSYQTPLMYINGDTLELDDLNLTANKLSITAIALGYVGYDTAINSFTHNKGASMGAIEIGNMSLGVAASLRGR